MKNNILGIEFGSTRIKAVAIDEQHMPISSGDYTWKSTYENGIWTYDLAAYMANKGEETLEEYLNVHVFAEAKSTTPSPEKADVDGFNAYIESYKNLLAVERKAVEVI